MATTVPLPVSRWTPWSPPPRPRRGLLPRTASARRGWCDRRLDAAVARARPAAVAAAVATAAVAPPAGESTIAQHVLLAGAAYVALALLWQRSVRGRGGAVAVAIADTVVVGALVSVSGGAASLVVALAPLHGLAIGLRFRPPIAVGLGVLAAAVTVGAAWPTGARAAAGWGLAIVVAAGAGIAVHAREVTQRRRLREAARLATETAAAHEAQLHRLWHELRTPVASLTALSRAVRQSTTMPPEARRRALDLVERHATHLGELLDEASGNRVGEVRPRADRDVWLPDLVDVAAVAAGVDGSRLDLRVAPDAALVRVDPRRVRQVLTNLLENAVRHGDPAERIAVEVRPRGEGLRVRVGNRASASPTPGSGLGLRIVRALVAELGGTLTVSTRDGGVVVAVDLPVASGASRSGASPSTRDPSDLAPGGHGSARQTR